MATGTTRCLSDEQRALVSNNIDLPLALARAKSRRWPTIAEDLESAALLALNEAALKFDTSKYPPEAFRCFANRRITGAITDEIRRLRPHGYIRGRGKAGPAVRVLSIDSPNHCSLAEKGGEVNKAEISELLSEEGWQVPIDSKLDLDSIFADLDRPWRFIIKCLFLHEMTTDQVATRMGWTVKRVRKVREVALERLRREHPEYVNN